MSDLQKLRKSTVNRGDNDSKCTSYGPYLSRYMVYTSDRTNLDIYREPLYTINYMNEIHFEMVSQESRKLSGLYGVSSACVPLGP